jgi:hypothetical protein
MQKVVGSSPIIRSEIPANEQVAVVRSGNDGCSVAALVVGSGPNCARDLAINAQPATLKVSTLATRFPANRPPFAEVFVS